LYGYLIGQFWVSVFVHVLTAVCKGTKHHIKVFNLTLGNFEFAANCEDLRPLLIIKQRRPHLALTPDTRNTSSLFHLLLSHTLLFNRQTSCFKHSILLMVK
jgi:hypothetical protein